MNKDPVDRISELILDLSLATSLPLGPNGRDYVRASAAASSMANQTSKLEKKDIRNYEWTIPAVLNILIVDIDHPVASKAALALRTLMCSRICMNRLIESDGMQTIGKVIDIMLAKKTPELKRAGETHSLVEHLFVVYREIARFYPWNIVNVGGIRHCVIILRHGDLQLIAIAATTMASLSNDLNICKQMFSYGAIKPLLVITDGDRTNDACMLAGLGCVTQLCRIPEIAVRIVQQGVVPVLEKALHRHHGYSNQSIREKGLYSLGSLSTIASERRALCTPTMLEGIKNELATGTMSQKLTILHILMNIKKQYDNEREYLISIRDIILHLLQTGTWHCKTLCMKLICVLYREDEDREYMVEHGKITESIIEVIESKNREMQEVPLVTLIHLCVVHEIPFHLMRKQIHKIIAPLLFAEDPIIRELTVLLYRVFLLYNQTAIEKVVPKEKDYILKRDIYNPQLYGEEYGGMIQEYLQIIVDNRREYDYLIRQFSDEELKQLGLNYDDLVLLQNLFMSLDAECTGVLGIDELKMLVILKGEVMDKAELDALLAEYDSDKSGAVDFKEFVRMMQSWDGRFGSGLQKFYNEAIRRGPIGKSLAAFSNWWNRDNYESGQVEVARQKKIQAKQGDRKLELRFSNDELIKEKRERAKLARDMGLVYSENYKKALPPIKKSYRM